MFVRRKDKEDRYGPAVAGEKLMMIPIRPNKYDPWVKDENLASLPSFWVRVSPKVLDTWK